MSRTVPTILALTLALGLGSSWADENPEASEQILEADESAVLAEELAQRLAEKLSGRDAEPGFLLPEPSRRAQLLVPPMPGRSQVTTCLAGSDGCDVARDLVAMPACLDPDDCFAYEAWKRAYRQPEARVVPAEPYSWPSPELASYDDEREDDEREHP